MGSFKLEAAFRAAEAAGMGFDAALNSVAVLACEASEHHSMYVLLRNFHQAIQGVLSDAAVQAAMSRLLELALVAQLRERAGTFLGLLHEEHIDSALARSNALLDEIRPDCVGLTDGFGFTDDQLKSTLGRFDGCVYEAIYAEAKLSPLNQASRMVGWEHMAPILDLDFLREGMQLQRAGGRAEGDSTLPASSL